MLVCSCICLHLQPDRPRAMDSSKLPRVEDGVWSLAARAGALGFLRAVQHRRSDVYELYGQRRQHAAAYVQG